MIVVDTASRCCQYAVNVQSLLHIRAILQFAVTMVSLYTRQCQSALQLTVDDVTKHQV